MKRHHSILLSCLACLMTLMSAWADTTPASNRIPILSHPDAQAFIKNLDQRHILSKNQLSKIFKDAYFDLSIIQTMERPYEKKSWNEYQKALVTPQRIQEGVQYMLNHKTSLTNATTLTSVPPELITAIIGIESKYGQQMGRHNTLNSLATLAFHYPKRQKFFRSELEKFLILCHVFTHAGCKFPKFS